MIKFICSSYALFDALRKTFAQPPTESIMVSTSSQELVIGEIRLSVEARGVAAAKIPTRQLKRLYNILVMLSDQPLTIEYNETNEWLTIQEVIL